MPRILFVIAPNMGWDNKLMPVPFPHTGVGYLAAYLKKGGFEVSVLDTSLDYANARGAIRAAVEKHRPDVVGITVYTALAGEAGKIVSWIREATAVPIIAGGPHISVTNKEFLERTGADFGIMREGEIPLSQFMTVLARKGGEAEYAGIPGLIFRKKNGDIVIQENTSLVTDLDQLPFPDLSDFELDRYPLWRSKHYQLITSRGCPYACTYCAAPLVTGRKFRCRSAGNVVDEIELHVKQGFTRFGIMDDSFNVDIDRAKEICRLILERKLNIVWEMGNGIRANSVDRELFQLLKKSGCNFVGAGMETGNEQMLKRIKKGLTIRQMNDFLAYANEVGIGTAVNFILGHPGETYATALDTITLAEKLPASYVNIYGLMPVKGTEAYNELKALEKQGKARFLYDHDYYLTHFSSAGVDPVFETPEFTKEQRRELLIRGRNITKRRALEYRFGKALGRILYGCVRNHAVFMFFNRVRTSPAGAWIYQKIRHED